MKKIVILISGGGSNMRAICDYAVAQSWQARGLALIAAVVSNRADAPGLAWAQAQGIPTRLLAHSDYATRAAYDADLAALIDEYAPDLLVLAGFMRLLTPEFTTHYAGRMLNIHPSLLPNFKGLHTHAQALAAGVAVHGATVHEVTAELDDGPIWAQAVVPVLPEDDEARLAARVLEVEHQMYPRVIEAWLHAADPTSPSARPMAFCHGFNPH